MRKRTGNIQDRGTSFRIRYHDADGIRQHESYSTREEAERQLANRLAEIANGIPVSSKPNTVLFGELANDVLTDYEINGFKSRADAEARYRLHLLPHFERRRACQITTAQFKTYIRIRQSEGAAAGTINRELELARHTFKMAFDGHKILVKPYIPKLRETNVRTGFFTRDEVDRLCRHLPETLAAMVRFAFLTGWRLEEIRQLLWRQIDFERNEIRLDVGSTKNLKGRVIPMSAEVRAILLTVLAAQRTIGRDKMKSQIATAAITTLTAKVFPVGEFRKTWKTACYKAGLPCIVEPIKIRGHQQFNADGTPKVKVIKALRTFHDLRRSFAREMDRMGIRQGAIMQLGGWLTDSVFRRYAIVSESDLRDAVEKMDAHPRGHPIQRHSEGS